ncbi:MAG: amidinotransferase [Saprospiraceae bacterium]|nr:amidinotransferase [Candidatus Defluviibacterium haderslevense]
MEIELQVPTYIMNIPTSYSTDIRNNLWMEEYYKDEIIVNLSKAIHEMWEVYSFLSCEGFVYLLPNPKGSKLQDLTFVANNGIVLHNIENPTFVGSNFTAKNRIGEENIGLNFFDQLGYQTIKCPHLFEGEADMKFIKDNIYVAGYGMRTEKAAHKWFEDKFGIKIISLQMTDPYIYHLDCAVFTLSKDKMIVATEAFSKQDIKQLEKHVEIIPVTIGHSRAGLTNSVRVNNYIINGSDIDFLKKTSKDYKMERDKNNKIEEIAADNGMEVCYFNLEEFMKGGALMSCLVLNVNYKSYKSDLF